MVGRVLAAAAAGAEAPMPERPEGDTSTARGEPHRSRAVGLGARALTRRSS